MTAGGDGATTGTRAAVWCGTCGIPYAAETAYCAMCGAPLVAPDVEAGATRTALSAPDESGGSAAIRSATPGESQIAAPDVPEAAPQSPDPLPGGRTLDEAFPGPPRGLLDRVRQRQRTLSEDEIDAAAAAIIAQARHAAALAPLVDPAPDPVVEDALQRRRDRDRAWLIGGILCCVLLILFALIVSRSMSIGLLR